MFNKSGKGAIFYSIVFFFLFVTFTSLASAEVYKQWDDVEISHPIRIDGEVDSSITANLTVKNPEGTVIISFAEMTFDSSIAEHNYTVGGGHNGIIGTYPYCISATNGTDSETACFDYEITPSGQTGLLGFYIIIIVLSYGVMILGLYKKDVTITILGTFALFFLGIYILYYGIDVYKNYLTEGFSIITLGIAFYVSAKAAQEYLT